MIEITFSPSFKRSFKKRLSKQPEMQERFWKKVEVFTKDPFDNQLKTHKLSGKLREVWSFAIDYDCRVLFYFSEKNNAVFFDIGSHDEVY